MPTVVGDPLVTRARSVHQRFNLSSIGLVHNVLKTKLRIQTSLQINGSYLNKAAWFLEAVNSSWLLIVVA